VPNDEWTKEQLKPLSMFELAKWWADALKVIGTGNGAGILAAGAALGPLENNHHSLFWVKLAGATFFVGVLAFAVAFAKLHQAMFAQDEVAHATIRKDVTAIKANSNLSGSAMMAATRLAYVAAVAFFVVGVWMDATAHYNWFCYYDWDCGWWLQDVRSVETRTHRRTTN
jgi:hypothetical protein